MYKISKIKANKLLILLFSLYFINTTVKAQQVGIGTNTPDSSAILDIQSTNSGLLIPRMTSVQRIAISTPAKGLLVFDNTTNSFWFYDGTTWGNIATANVSLEDAYNNGANGNGRKITANDSAVIIDGTDGLYVTGTFGIGTDVEIGGAGSRMFFNPKQSAFRSGEVNGSQWDASNTGNRSTALGYNTIASGSTSTAMGSFSIASGKTSTAIGNNSQANGKYATAIGNGAHAIGIGSIALGTESYANGNYSFSLGKNAKANAPNSMALNNRNIANGFSSTVLGLYNDTIVGVQNSMVYNTPLFIVGNGTGPTTRSNAFVVKNNGRVQINDAYHLPIADGGVDYILKTDGAGTTSFVDASTIFSSGVINTDIPFFTRLNFDTINSPRNGQTVYISDNDVTLMWNGVNWVVLSNDCFPQPTVANAGINQNFSDASITALLAANTPAEGVGTWTILSGSGIFSDIHNPNASFSSSACSSNTLVWSIVTDCDSTWDFVAVSFYESPTSPSAGPNQYFSNATTTATLAANSIVVGTGLWTIVSGAGGAFANATDPNTIFTGTSCTNYTLKWTASQCVNISDNVNIVFNPSINYVYAGSNYTANSMDTTKILNANTPTYGIGTWSVVSGVGGSFANVNDPSTVFTGNSCSLYVLRWTISTDCNSVYDDINISFYVTNSYTNAGPYQSISTEDTIVTLNAYSFYHGTGYWSVTSGLGGTFSDVNDPNSTFTGNSCTNYSLLWTVVACNVIYDNIIISFNASNSNSTITAGINQTITNSYTSTTLNASTTYLGLGTWSVTTGTGGSFSNIHDPLSSFSGNPCNSYLLKWTVVACNSISKNVSISFYETSSGPSLDAGNDIFSLNNTTVTLNASGVGGSWSIVSGTGGSFSSLTDSIGTFTGNNNSSYTLAWSSQGCQAYDEVNIFIGNVVGQNAYGGVIFYVDGTGNSGLIVALTGQGIEKWACSNSNISTNVNIGSGNQNTLNINANSGCVSGFGSTFCAAKRCAFYSYAGFNDWFLPSKNELLELSNNRVIVNKTLSALSFVHLTSANYWSSNQYSFIQASRISLSTGVSSNHNKNYSQYYRPVRAF